MNRFATISFGACAALVLSLSTAVASDEIPKWTAAGDAEVPFFATLIPLPPQRPAVLAAPAPAPRVRLAQTPVVRASVPVEAAAPRRSTQIWLSMGSGF